MIGYARQENPADESRRLLRAQYPQGGHLVDGVPEVVSVAHVWALLALVEEVKRVADALEERNA